MVWNLYYDGGCNLCHASKLRAEHWAKKSEQPLNVDILQSPSAIQKGFDTTTMVLEADKTYFGADAWLKIMTLAPWYLRWISWFRLTPPTAWLAKSTYTLIAKFRYRWFGTRACPLPNRNPPGRTS